MHCFVKFLYLYLDLSQYKINELSFSFSRTTEIPGDSAWETILGNEESHQQEVKKFKWNYSLWKPPYSLPINMATLFLKPHYCGRTNPQTVIFLFKKNLKYDSHPIKTIRFLWPIGDWMNKVLLYLTYLIVIPGACIGYEMVEAQKTKLADVIISYPTGASRIILFHWTCPHNIENQTKTKIKCPKKLHIRLPYL